MKFLNSKVLSFFFWVKIVLENLIKYRLRVFMLFMLKLSIYLLSRQLKIEKKLFIDKLFVVFNKHCTKNFFLNLALKTFVVF